MVCFPRLEGTRIPKNARCFVGPLTFRKWKEPLLLLLNLTYLSGNVRRFYDWILNVSNYLWPSVINATRASVPKAKTKTVQPDDIQFGKNWTKGGLHGLPEIVKRLSCARYKTGNVPLWEQRKAIIQTAFPNYVWHYWTEQRIQDLSEFHFTSWIGPAASSKTSDAAIAALEYWMEAPHKTAVIVCSTTKDMLRTRIWGSIVEWFGQMTPEVRKVIFPPGYGELLDASCFIRWCDGDWKNGIKGIAIQDGPVQEAVNNIIGMHTERVFVILDEAQGVREAIMGAIPNLQKNPESKFHIMGNPSDFNSLLCRYSAPLEGWKSIQKFQDHWEIDSLGYPGKGRCRFFDGRKSPAILDPEWGKRNPWMINQGHINDHLNSNSVGGNEGHPDFMWQTIGWPPDKGIEQTVLDHSIVQTFMCTEKPVWTNGFTEFAALDSSQSTDGDDTILQIMRRGLVKEEGNPERWVIAGVDQIVVPISAEDPRPVEYQIVNFVKDQCKKRNIPSGELAVASAGAGASLASIFDTEWGTVNRVQEAGSPSDRVVDERGRTAKEKYNTRASELCLVLKDWALGNGLRHVPSEVIEQACKRLTFDLNGKTCAEPKTATKGLQQAKGQNSKGFKQRIGRSPDHLDAWNIGLEHARQKGAEPSFGQSSPKRYEDWNKNVEQASEEITNYDEQTDWQEESNYALM